jgi:hypothetical protein
MYVSRKALWIVLAVVVVLVLLVYLGSQSLQPDDPATSRLIGPVS